MLKPVPQRQNPVTDDSPLPRSWQKQTAINPIELSAVLKSLDPQSPEHRFLIIFWIRMAEIFQQFWTNAQGTIPTDMWAQTLLAMGEESTQEAMVYFIKKGDKYPPTLPEFYAAGYQYRLRQARYALPKQPPVVDRDKSKAQLELLKKSLNRSTTQH